MITLAITRALAFGVPSAFILTVTVRALRRRLRERRADREWAAEVAGKVRARRLQDRDFLAWEAQFDTEGSDLS